MLQEAREYKLLPLPLVNWMNYEMANILDQRDLVVSMILPAVPLGSITEETMHTSTIASIRWSNIQPSVIDQCELS